VAAFPDVHVHIEDEIAEGDWVVTRMKAHGTHQGELMGIPATGKEVTDSVIHVARIVDGKIVERWEQADLMGMMQQLGVVPEPGG
jgi:predicted ester cyclase